MLVMLGSQSVAVAAVAAVLVLVAVVTVVTVVVVWCAVLGLVRSTCLWTSRCSFFFR